MEREVVMGMGGRRRIAETGECHRGKNDDWFKTECDIRMDFDTNEYPNIFVSRK